MTAGESGTYYEFGSAIARHATEHAGITVTALISNGSQANVIDLADGVAELAFCQSDVMAYAYEGTNLFNGQPIDVFSTVAALYDEQVQIVTCNPEVKAVSDLKGKTVSIGAVGSGVYFNALDVLDVCGVKEEDITARYLGFGDSASALKEGIIDAAFIVAGAPIKAIADLASSSQISLVSLDEEQVEKLLRISPYYNKAVVKAGTYAGVDKDVVTVAVSAAILAADSVSDADVYALVSDIFENAPSLVSSNAKYGELSIDKGASIVSVPYHPGAARYFEEKGKKVAVR